MNRLSDMKLVADIAQTVTSTVSTIFDRFKRIKEISDRVTKLEVEMKELKDKP